MREKKEEKPYIGRMRETELIKRGKKALTKEEQEHNLEKMIEFCDRPKITRNRGDR